MYKVKVDEKLLCFTGSVNGMEYVTDPDVKLVVNGVDSFSFAIYPQHPLYKKIVCKVSRVKIWRDSELLFYGEVTGYSQDMYGIRTYDCEGALAWLNDLHFAYAISGATPKDVLYWYIKMYNQKLRDKSKSFELGTVTVHKAMTQDGTEGTIARSSGVYPSFWEEIQDKLLDSFGGILRVRYVGSDTCAGYIDWLAIPDGTCAQDVRYAKNLLNCDWTYDCTSIATAVVPLGKRKDSSGDNEVRLTIDKADDDDATFMIQYMTGTDDLVKSGNMVYSKSRMEKYGLIQQAVTFDDITDAGTLAYQGAVWLRQNGKAASTISAEAIDLADIDESVEHFTLGDYVRTKLPSDIAENLFPITAIEIPIAAPENAKLTVGTQESSITSGSGGQGGGSITNAGSGADAMAHTHSNKGVLDKITEQDCADFKGAVNKAHIHANKDTLDKIEQPYTTAERDKLAGLENYTHPTHTAHAKGFYKFASDGEGHVTDVAYVDGTDMYNLGCALRSDIDPSTYSGELPLCFAKAGLDEELGTLKDCVGGLEGAAYIRLSKWANSHREAWLIVGGNQGGESLGCLCLHGKYSFPYVIKPPSGEDEADGHTYTLPAGKDGTFALTSDIPDISGKLDKTGDASTTTVAFSAASARENIKTGEKLSVIVGKIAKWFADLKTVAFTGSYNDLANKPTIPDGSKYLPLAGGVMTGDIDLASNGVDLLVGSQRATQTTYATAVAGATISTKQTFSSGLPERKSLVGSFLDQNSVWHSIISVRHRNGYNDGVNYGMYLRSLLTSDGSLFWNKQTGAGKWQGERVLLDSTNYSSYAAKSDHTHDAITNSSRWASGANNAAQWVRLGTVVSSGNFATTVISVWSGDGANGNASQNSWFDIHIKDGWQSTESATKACGVTVYRTRCGMVKVKVIPTAHNTYTVWVYLPWTYWNGNYSVHGKYSSWTPQVLKQTAEPDGTAADTAYYDQAFLTSTVAAAKTLTDSGWVAMTVEGYAKSGTVKYRTYGKQITITGRSVVLKTDIATSYPAPQYIASTTFDFSKIVGCSGVGRSSSGVGAYVAVENYNGDNLVSVYALGSKIAAGSTLYFTITGFID